MYAIYIRGLDICKAVKIQCPLEKQMHAKKGAFFWSKDRIEKYILNLRKQRNLHKSYISENNSIFK